MPDDAVDLGPKPEPQIEPGEPNPGGPDAIADGDGVDGETAEPDPDGRDLDPEANPDAAEQPDEVKEGDDTDTEATRSESGTTGVDTEKEPTE